MTNTKRKVGTIDLTPKWIGVLPIFIEGLLNGTAKGQAIAREELANMARLADDRNERVAAPLDWKPVSEYVNVGDGTTNEPEPQVMLWEARAGVALGKVLKFADGDIFTSAAGYHGFTFTHYAVFNVPK